MKREYRTRHAAASPAKDQTQHRLKAFRKDHQVKNIHEWTRTGLPQWRLWTPPSTDTCVVVEVVLEGQTYRQNDATVSMKNTTRQE